MLYKTFQTKTRKCLILGIGKYNWSELMWEFEKAVIQIQDVLYNFLEQPVCLKIVYKQLVTYSYYYVSYETITSYSLALYNVLELGLKQSGIRNICGIVGSEVINRFLESKLQRGIGRRILVQELVTKFTTNIYLLLVEHVSPICKAWQHCVRALSLFTSMYI